MKAYDLTHLTRRVALLVLAAIGVHQLRYLIAYGSDSGTALAQQGHGYLETLLPDLAGLAVVVMLSTLAARMIVRSKATAGSGRRRPEWLLYTLAVLAIFCSQELIEGSLVSGHPAGIAALLDNGGWIAGPLALVFGMLVAFALHLLDRADRVLDALVPAIAARPRRPAATTTIDPQHTIVPLVRLALGFGFSRRPPPASARSV